MKRVENPKLTKEIKWWSSAYIIADKAGIKKGRTPNPFALALTIMK